MYFVQYDSPVSKIALYWHGGIWDTGLYLLLKRGAHWGIYEVDTGLYYTDRRHFRCLDWILGEYVAFAMLVQIWTLLEMMMACLPDHKWNPQLSQASPWLLMYATKFLIWLTLNADNRSGKIEALIGVGASVDNVLFAWLEIEPLVVSGANRSKSLWLLCADCWLLMAKVLQIWNDADRRFACSRPEWDP